MSVRKIDDGRYEFYETSESVYMTSDELGFQRQLVALQDRRASFLVQYDQTVKAAQDQRDQQLAAIDAELAKVKEVLAQIAKDQAAATPTA
jgi:hypothetical protein